MKLAAFGLVALLGMGTCTGLSLVQHSDRNNYQVKITGSERIVENSGESGVNSKYLVFTQDSNTGEERAFENTDTVLECAFSDCKFDSSTLQARLTAAEKSGAPCTLQTYGWRVPFMSWDENIVAADCKK